MINQLMVMNIVRFLHTLFTVLWIGGLVLTAFVILPGIRKNPKVSEPMVAQPYTPSLPAEKTGKMPEARQAKTAERKKLSPA